MYNQVADESPLPVIIYSFPAVCQGVDMDSDLLARLAKHTVRASSSQLVLLRSVNRFPLLTPLASEYRWRQINLWKCRKGHTTLVIVRAFRFRSVWGKQRMARSWTHGRDSGRSHRAREHPSTILRKVI
jgi:hypothetical protein